ncbi:MAG: hypothetical protein AAFV77_10110, partial [Planctomycetota bacterium]
HRERFEGFEFAVLDHDQGNGGCLVPNTGEVADTGVLIYLNVELEALEALPMHGDRQHIAVEGDRTIEVDDGDVEPDGAVVLGVEVVHGHHLPGLQVSIHEPVEPLQHGVSVLRTDDPLRQHDLRCIAGPLLR